MTVSVFAPAKINLTLHVTGQRDDGYHRLDSLVMFADVGDTLTVEAANTTVLSVTGPQVAGVPKDETNSVIQAASLMNRSVSVTLDKHLPTAAGIGGGTADAAACLRAISELFATPLPESVMSLGADVPVCMAGRAARMQSIGDHIALLTDLPPLFAVLANPGIAVSTTRVFGELETKENPPMPQKIPAFPSSRQFVNWLAQQRNDLQEPAILVQPVIGDVLNQLSGIPGCLLARMSGSGATCFGLFDNYGEAETGATDLRRAFPEWWITECALS